MCLNPLVNAVSQSKAKAAAATPPSIIGAAVITGAAAPFDEPVELAAEVADASEGVIDQLLSSEEISSPAAETNAERNVR